MCESAATLKEINIPICIEGESCESCKHYGSDMYVIFARGILGFKKPLTSTNVLAAKK